MTHWTARPWLGYALIAAFWAYWTAVVVLLLVNGHPWAALGMVGWTIAVLGATRSIRGRRRPTDAPLPTVSTLNSPRNRVAVALANTALRLARPSYRNVIKAALVLGFQEATRRATERARADSTPADEETTTA